MLVTNESGQIIGSLNKNFGNPPEGEIITINRLPGVFSGFDFYEHTRSSFAKIETLKARVATLKHSVTIDKMDLIHASRIGDIGKSDYIAMAAYDREFRRLLEVKGDVSIDDDIVRDVIIVTVRLKTLKVNIDTAEKLFDMDEFTPE